MLDYNREYKVVIIPSVFSKNDVKEDNGKSLDVLRILKEYNDTYDITEREHWQISEKITFDVDYETYEKLKGFLGLKGFYTFCYLKVDRSNAWSVENLITNTRNSNNGEKKDKDSLEIILNHKLKDNKDYKINFKGDIDGNLQESVNKDYLDNDNVRLTLDKDLQYQVKNILKNKYDKYEQIGVIVMEANTGKIKVMTQKNDKLPNVNIGAETLNGFFPGSIFKTIVLEGELEKGNSKDKTFKCTGLYESTHHGTLNVEKAFVVSCNHIYSQIGKDIGFDKIFELSKKQELFNKILGFHKEQRGKFEIQEPKWEDGTLAMTSIGQNIRITPIEAIGIVNTVANHGVFVRPYIVDAFVDKNNKEHEIMDTSMHYVISKENADTVKNMMKKVIKEGTGVRAYVKGIEMGGKTGSTERIEKVTDKNSNKKNKKFSDGWFIGFFEAEGKTYSTVVFVKNIDKFYESGGTTAAPIFKEIVKIFNNI